MTAQATRTRTRRNQNRTRRRADARLRLNSFRINRDGISRSQKGKLVRPLSILSPLLFSSMAPPLTFLMAISRHHEKGWFIFFPSYPLFSSPLPLFRRTNFPPSQGHKSSFSSSRKLAWSTPSPLPNCNLSSRSRKARISSRHALTPLTAPSLIQCPLVPLWAVPSRHPWVYPHIT